VRICVLGSSFGALATAFYARQRGVDVVLVPDPALVLDPGGEAEWRRSPAAALGTHRCATLEASSRADSFEHDGVRYDRAFAPIRGADTALCGLLAEIGVLSELRWVDRPARLFEAGLFEAELGSSTRRMRFPGVRVAPWFDRMRGRSALGRAICGPRLFELTKTQSKRLARAAAWRASHRAGVFPGGVRTLVAALRTRLEHDGVELRRRESVESIEPLWEERVRIRFRRSVEAFDAVVLAGPGSTWIKYVSSPIAERIVGTMPAPVAEIRVALMVDASSKIHAAEWVGLLREERGPRSGNREMTRELRFSHSASDPGAPVTSRGERPAYFTYRGPAHLPENRAPDAAWIRTAIATCAALSGDVPRADLDAAYVFRTPSVDFPLWGISPIPLALPKQLGSEPLFLQSNACQLARVPSLDTEVMCARETVGALLARASQGATL